RLFNWLNRKTNTITDVVADRYYVPLLDASLRRPSVAVSLGISLLLVAAGLWRGQIVPFNIFPKLDSNTIEVSVIFPDGTPAAITDQATRRIEQAIREIDEQY